VLKDQRQAYDRMRERCPVAYSEFLGWSLFRYDDVLRAIRVTITSGGGPNRVTHDPVCPTKPKRSR